MKTKICSKCKKRKSIVEFNKDKKGRNGLYYWCKQCRKEYYQNDKERLNNLSRDYYKTHKIKIKKYNKDYYKNHQKEREIYLKNNRKKIQEFENNRLKININYRIKVYLRNRIWYALKKNIKSNNTIELLGCSIEQLKKHLEKQFTNSMSWSNYGLWHIDHIKPCASFDLSKPEEQKKCFNYINLQPLWAKENLEKGDNCEGIN